MIKMETKDRERMW